MSKNGISTEKCPTTKVLRFLFSGIKSMRLLDGKNTFTSVPCTVRELIMEVETGKLGLPNLQRGYVWRATKVRDLLDSMMKGYPTDYLMIWGAADDTEKSKAVGIDNKPFSTPILIHCVLNIGVHFYAHRPEILGLRNNI